MAENEVTSTEKSDDISISDVEKKIIRQIEYYFGDFNLSRDNFLRGKLKDDDGWITLETLLTFNRLKCLTTDAEVVARALKKSKLMEVHEGDGKVRRDPANPLPENTEERKKEMMSRSVYAKGFPLTATLDELLAFFKGHGSLDNIQMRRALDKNFKGSVFAIFDTKEGGEKFVKDGDVKYEDCELKREMRSDYHARKVSERAKSKEAAKLKKAEHTKKQIEENQPTFERGCVLHVTGLDKATSREDFKRCFEPHAKVAWIDYDIGDADAWIRFTEPVAESALSKATEAGEGKLKIQGTEVVAKILEGDEEDKYWEKTFKAKQNGRQKRKDGARGRGRGGRGKGRGGGGGRHFKKGRKRDNSGDEAEEEPVAKQAKLPVKEESAADE